MAVCLGLAQVFPARAEQRSSDQADATAALVGVKPGPPPLSRLLVDVHLRNDAPRPRWVLIPADLPPAADPAGVYPGGIYWLKQQAAPDGAMPVGIALLAGSGSAYALRLAPGAQVTIHALEIRWWRPMTDAPAELTFDIRFADTVTAGGADIAGWFDADPMTTGTADVRFSAAGHSKGNGPADASERPMTATGAVTVAVALSVP